MLFLGRRHLLWVLGEYERHYNQTRPHRGVAEHRPPQPASPRPPAPLDPADVRRVDVMGGLIHEYEPIAA